MNNNNHIETLIEGNYEDYKPEDEDNEEDE